MHLDRSLRSNLLDLLVDGPSSFGALYLALSRHYGYPTTHGSDPVLDALDRMEADQLVRSWQMADSGAVVELGDHDRARARVAYRDWLPTAASGDASYDPVGLWYELGPAGRELWMREACETADMKRWTLDDFSRTKTILIRAATRDVAEQALQEWLSLNDGLEVRDDTKSVRNIPGFELRSGDRIAPAVELTCQYRRPSQARERKASR